MTLSRVILTGAVVRTYVIAILGGAAIWWAML
jgi:hypothetical protein